MFDDIIDEDLEGIESAYAASFDGDDSLTKAERRENARSRLRSVANRSYGDPESLFDDPEED